MLVFTEFTYCFRENWRICTSHPTNARCRRLARKHVIPTWAWLPLWECYNSWQHLANIVQEDENHQRDNFKVVYQLQLVTSQNVYLQTDGFYTESSPHRSLTHRRFYAQHFLHTDALHTDVFTQTQNAHREVLLPLLDHLPFMFPLKYCMYIYIYIIYSVFLLHHDILLFINIAIYYYKLVVNIWCCFLIASLQPLLSYYFV